MKKWSPNLSIGFPHVQVVGGGGKSGSRSFRCIKILNSSVENLFVASERVDCPRGMDVNVLNVDGNCFCIGFGSLCHICFRRLVDNVFFICFVEDRIGACRVYVSSVYGMCVSGVTAPSMY